MHLFFFTFILWKESIHPSWEAKKNMNRKLSQKTNQKQNKHIKFD